MPREIEGEPFDCKQCGWVHRPSQACPQTKLTPKVARVIATAAPQVDPLVKFAEWEARAKEQPTIERNTGAVCGFCKKPVMEYRNFLGAVWEEIDGELLPDHAKQHVALVTETRNTPDLERPRRSRKDIDD